MSGAVHADNRLPRCGGDFIASGADIVGVMDDASVDLVICCYSLYFPQIVSDIYRVLRNGGVLLAITHSENTLRRRLRLYAHA